MNLVESNIIFSSNSEMNIDHGEREFVLNEIQNDEVLEVKENEEMKLDEIKQEEEIKENQPVNEPSVPIFNVSIGADDVISSQDPVNRESFTDDLNYFVDFNTADSPRNPANTFHHCPMVCRTTDGKDLANTITQLSKTVLSQANIEFRPECWIFHPAQLQSGGCIFFKLLNAEFENYYCPQRFSMVVDLKEIAICLESIKPALRQTVTFTLNRQAEFMLEIYNPDTGNKAVYPIRQLDTVPQRLRIPALQSDYQICLNLSWYKETISILDKIGKQDKNQEITLRLNSDYTFDILIPGGYKHTCKVQQQVNGVNQSNAVNQAVNGINHVNGINLGQQPRNGVLIQNSFNIENLKEFLQVQNVNKNILRTSISKDGLLIFEQMHGKNNTGCLQYFAKNLIKPPIDSDNAEQLNETAGEKRPAPRVNVDMEQSRRIKNS